MDTQCLFFTYNVTAKQCRLKAGLGTSVLTLQPYYISGPKYCGFSSGNFSMYSVVKGIMTLKQLNLIVAFQFTNNCLEQ